MWTRSQLQLQPQPQPFVVVCCTGAYDMYDIRWRWAEWGWKRFLDVAKKCWANLKWKLKKNGNETKMFRGVGEVPKRTISADPRQAHLPTIWNFGRVQISWHVQILGFQPPLNEFNWIYMILVSAPSWMWHQVGLLNELQLSSKWTRLRDMHTYNKT